MSRTQEDIEEAGYRFDYRMHFGRVVEVRVFARDGMKVCAHWHTQGAVDAFNRMSRRSRSHFELVAKAAKETA